jgi:hypothetical protein
MSHLTYREFWPFYVSQHRKPVTRRLHFIGTTAVILCVVGAILLREPLLLVVGLVAAYGPAWIGHFFIERNRPATFRNPFLSIVGDFHMYGLMWAGRMNEEVRRVAAARSPDA